MAEEMRKNYFGVNDHNKKIVEICKVIKLESLITQALYAYDRSDIEHQYPILLGFMRLMWFERESFKESEQIKIMGESIAELDNFEQPEESKHDKERDLFLSKTTETLTKLKRPCALFFRTYARFIYLQNNSTYCVTDLKIGYCILLN